MTIQQLNLVKCNRQFKCWWFESMFILDFTFVGTFSSSFLRWQIMMFSHISYGLKTHAPHQIRKICDIYWQQKLRKYGNQTNQIERTWNVFKWLLFDYQNGMNFIDHWLHYHSLSATPKWIAMKIAPEPCMVSMSTWLQYGNHPHFYLHETRSITNKKTHTEKESK